MTLLEFKEAKKHYRKISKNHNLTAKIKKGNWTAVDVIIWWMKYTKSKEFKELYKGKIAVRPDIYYSKDNVWKRMSAFSVLRLQGVEESE